jgi:hypothetical protein
MNDDLPALNARLQNAGVPDLAVPPGE